MAGMINVAGNAADTTHESDEVYWKLGSTTLPHPNVRDITSGTAGSYSCAVGWDFVTGVGSMLWQECGDGMYVTIVSPTLNPTYTVTGNTISMSGSAGDAYGPVGSVTWSNSLGGNGTCTGTSSWSVNGIVLQVGNNAITITATDSAGRTESTGLVVDYTPAVGHNNLSDHRLDVLYRLRHCYSLGYGVERRWHQAGDMVRFLGRQWDLHGNQLLVRRRNRAPTGKQRHYGHGHRQREQYRNRDPDRQL